jgi:hypothetical protein
MQEFLKFILEWKSTCFGQFLCPSSGVFHCTYSNGIRHTGLLTAFEQNQFHPDPACKLSANVYDIQPTIAVCTVKNSWWWTEELSETCRVSFQNKFEKVVHLVGFIIRICHDARSQERKKKNLHQHPILEHPQPTFLPQWDRLNRPLTINNTSTYLELINITKILAFEIYRTPTIIFYVNPYTLSRTAYNTRAKNLLPYSPTFTVF